MPLVSVVMPVFSGERFLAEAIESILAQTFTDFEFIIVDDGSKDRSAEIADAYAEHDNRIRVVKLERNRGEAEARNHGIAFARGEFIAAMDCDDVSLPQRLQRQLDVLARNPEIGVLGTGAQAVNEELRPLFNFDLPQQHALIVFNLFVGSFFIHPSAMMRRDVLSDVGGYEPSRLTAPDTELWSRLMWRTRFANLPERLLLYRWHDAQIHRTRDAVAMKQSSDVRERLLKRLWGEVPRESLVRFERIQRDEKLGPLDRRRARRDLARLLDALIGADIIDRIDRGLVEAHIERRLEGTMPRNWQKFLHWRRHHFGR
ncbi:MAG: glycosyltransferase family 2 protein [Chloroflexota bacterium]|nr:glycosyltransferase family 2 protein [Chloroflexota bacterium]